MNDSDLPQCRQALLLIDFVNPLDFEGSEDLAQPALRAAKATLKLLRAVRANAIPVIYANDNFGTWQSDFGTMVKRLEKKGGPSAAIVKMVRPKRGDLTILKPMHSAFFGTPLDIVLNKIGVRSLIVAGLACDICVQLTAADAFLRGLKIYVPPECTAAESEARKAAALVYMRDILKCDVEPLKQLLASLPP